jgi:hypothetical protein
MGGREQHGGLHLVQLRAECSRIKFIRTRVCVVQGRSLNVLDSLEGRACNGFLVSYWHGFVP